MKKLFTSESVTPGHPDKLCDQVADRILDEYLKYDPNSRVACEVCANKDGLVVMGEITSKAKIDLESLIRKTIVEIGYDSDDLGFNGNTIDIKLSLNNQSADIALGVDNSYDQNDLGAGDQGMMFGYATNETENYMPYPLFLAHSLSKRLREAYENKEIAGLLPDGKSQVTVLYDDDVPKYVDTIVVSAQNKCEDIECFRNEIKHKVIDKVIPKHMIDNKTKIFINPTGKFEIGGPYGDSGLTGRKIIVDTYGGVCGHGGGAFSGKDPTKVDRSAAYYARYVAKNIVASGLCDKLELQVAYAIGVSKPISLNINTYGTNKISEEKILEIINKVFNFEPRNIIKELNLLKSIYHLTTCFGHFGKNNLTWERLDKVDEIKSLKD